MLLLKLIHSWAFAAIASSIAGTKKMAEPLFFDCKDKKKPTSSAFFYSRNL